jgi:ankyrin repeat protein
VVQGEDGMLLEGVHMKYAYLDGKVRTEAEFSGQWTGAFAISPPDTNAIKRAGLDVTIEICLPDQKKQYVIFPGTKAYCEWALPAEAGPPKEGDMKVERREDGSEVIDGHRCVRSKLTIRKSKPVPGTNAVEEKMEATLWEAQDLNRFPIKLRARMETPVGVFIFTEAFTDVKLVAPNRLLFIPPTTGFKAYRSMNEFFEAVQQAMIADEQRSEKFWSAVEKGDLALAESLWKQSPELIQTHKKDGQTPLHVAARAGRKEIVQWLIGKKVDANALDNKNLTPLHEAAAAGQRSIVELLLKAGAKVDAEDNDGRTPLLVAAASSKKETVDALLVGAANLNKCDSQEMTALHHAAAQGAKEVAALLLSRNAEPNAENKRGLTPLWEAMIQGYEDVVTLLATHGGDINIAGLDKQKPLRWAIKNGRFAMAYTLFENNADPELRANWAIPLLLPALARADADLVNFILDLKDDDVNAKVHGAGKTRGLSETPLHAATVCGWVDMVKLLIEQKANVNATGAGPCFTPLHRAVINGNEEIARLLIAAKADVNAKGCNKDSVLWYAVASGKKTVVKMLLDGGADIHAKGKGGCTLLSAAPDQEMESLLLSHGAERTKETHPSVAPDAGSTTEKKLSSASEVWSFPWSSVQGLVEAVRKGDLARARQSLDKYPYYVNLEALGEKPLWAAVKGGSAEIVELLLSKKADVNARDQNGMSGRYGWTALHLAAGSGNITAVLLANGADAHAVTWSTGWTALHFAAQKGSKEVAEMLLARGISVGVRTRRGETPLHLAASSGNPDLVSLLLGNKADALVKDNDGATPFHYAAAAGHTNVMAVLLKVGADVRLADGKGMTPLHLAAAGGHADAARMLLAAAADARVASRNGTTPLQMAVLHGRTDVVRLLLANKADITSKDSKGVTLLHCASAGQDTNIVRILLAAGANVRAVNQTGTTPLHVAATKGNPEIVSMLLMSKADVSAKDKKGTTPLHCASAGGNTNVVSLLLGAAADVRLADDKGATPLHVAKNEGAAKLLLAAGGDPNVLDQHQRTPLMCALSAGRKDIAIFLLAHGARVDICDDRGWTPLHETVAAGQKEIAEILVADKADPNVRAKDGKAPLHLAPSRELVDFLCTHGADINALTTNGLTPADEARRANRIDLATYIHQRVEPNAKTP